MEVIAKGQSNTFDIVQMSTRYFLEHPPYPKPGGTSQAFPMTG